MLRQLLRTHRVSLCLTFGLPLLFGLYVAGISHNPPGFFIDESGIAYNAWLIATTGASEAGVRWPIMFQVFSGRYAQYVSPTYTYLLAAAFALFKPGIVLARLVSCAAVFTSAVLLGVLGRRISGRIVVGAIVALIALATPWLFEIGRLVFETCLVPLFLVLLLLSVYRAHKTEEWRPVDSLKIAASLSLITYTYSSGRILAPLLCLALLLFATNRRRLAGVIATIFIYAATLIPLLRFSRNHSGALMNRFFQVSYVASSPGKLDIAVNFFRRFLQDLNPWRWLVIGDANPRHHVPGSLGSFLLGALVLAILGIVIVLIKHRSDRWWLFILFGLVASIIPGAITVDPFHTLRLIGLPVFLCVLAIPAISWLLPDRRSGNNETAHAKPTTSETSKRNRRIVLALLLTITGLQAGYFQWVFHREGPKRGGYFDAEYKEVFDAANASSSRPIYLQDAAGPSYLHALWYAAVAGRNAADFIHLEDDAKPPSGALVISSGEACSGCTVILEREPFVLYLAP